MRKLIVLLRKKILVLAALLLFGVLLLCGTFVRGALPVFRPSGVPERSVIIIDAGHGGEDGGAVAAGGTDCPTWPTFREGASVTAVCRAMGESDANGSVWTRVEGADA